MMIRGVSCACWLAECFHAYGLSILAQWPWVGRQGRGDSLLSKMTRSVVEVFIQFIQQSFRVVGINPLRSLSAEPTS